MKHKEKDCSGHFKIRPGGSRWTHLLVLGCFVRPDTHGRSGCVVCFACPRELHSGAARLSGRGSRARSGLGRQSQRTLSRMSGTHQRRRLSPLHKLREWPQKASPSRRQCRSDWSWCGSGLTAANHELRHQLRSGAGRTVFADSPGSQSPRSRSPTLLGG